jgi:hypothetical protein
VVGGEQAGRATPAARTVAALHCQGDGSAGSPHERRGEEQPPKRQNAKRRLNPRITNLSSNRATLRTFVRLPERGQRSEQAAERLVEGPGRSHSGLALLAFWRFNRALDYDHDHACEDAGTLGAACSASACSPNPAVSRLCLWRFNPLCPYRATSEPLGGEPPKRQRRQTEARTEWVKDAFWWSDRRLFASGMLGIVRLRGSRPTGGT